MRRLLQHWTESSIIPTSKEESVWRNKKPKKRTVLFRGRQSANLINEYFRVTGVNDSVENYADLFAIVLRNDDNLEFDSKWDEILLSMTQSPSDDILERLYKVRIREYEKLKTVLELYNMDIHQKKAGPECHRLKTMGKKEVSSRIWEWRIWSQKSKIWNKRRGQESDGKTVWTKKSRRLLAMENQRAVF